MRMTLFFRAWDIWLAVIVCGAAFIMTLFHTMSSSSDPGLSPARQDQVQTILNAGFFGTATVDNVSSQPAMNMDLRGIIAGSGTNTSYAIIAVAGQQEKSYRVGEALPDGSKVEAISADEITLRMGETRRTLSLKAKK